MSKKEAVRSPLFDVKVGLEEKFEEGELSLECLAYIDNTTLQELKARCEYLAHAYELEWKGIISVETFKNFQTISELDEYIAKNDLGNHPQGKDKQVVFCGIGQFSEGYSLLDNFRPANTDEMERYRDIPKTLKEAKLLRLANKQFHKQVSEAFKLYNKSEKLAEDLSKVKTGIGRRIVEAKMRKVEERLNEKSAQIAFVKQFE